MSREIVRDGNVLRLVKKALDSDKAVNAAAPDVKEALTAFTGNILQLENRLKNLPPAKLRDLAIAQALKIAALEERIIRIESRLGIS